MTLDMQILRSKFEADGFVAIPGFIGPTQLAELNSNLERFTREVVPALPADHVFYEDKQRPESLKQLQLMQTYDRYFEDLFARADFVQLAETLLGDVVVGKNLQYFNKPPGIAQPTPAHQDGYYFKLEPPEAVTMWLALDVVNEENGCVRYICGSHRRGMRPHGRTGVLGFSQGISDFGKPEDLADEVAFPAQPGDLLVHHALTIHRADGNRSVDRNRRSLGFIYYAEKAREDVATATQYQEQVKREWLAENKI